MPLLPVKKQKTPACLREIQVYRLWTKVYSPRGMTPMETPGCRIDQIVFLGENEIGADFDTLISLVTIQ